MSKAMITNSDSIDETPPSAKDRILSLNREVVGCRVCLRLANYRESGGQGQEEAISQLELLGQTCPRFRRHQGFDSVVGLAPAPHGGNRTGRVFTGDRSADFLVKAFFKAGYSNQSRSVDADDG